MSCSEKIPKKQSEKFYNTSPKTIGEVRENTDQDILGKVEVNESWLIVIRWVAGGRRRNSAESVCCQITEFPERRLRRM